VGEAPFEELHSKAIRHIRDRRAPTPEAANNWLKSIKALFKWAVEEEHCSQNPARDVPKIRGSTDGFHTWTIDEVEQWEAFYPVGTKQRLALALLLYTGCRRADVVTFGPQHIKDGWLTYTQNKNQSINPVTLTLPVVPALSKIIAATSSGHMTFIVSEYGKPYTVEGLANAGGNGRLPRDCATAHHTNSVRPGPREQQKTAQLRAS
jgi:integrase